MLNQPSTRRLLPEIAGLENLALAWRKVRQNIAVARRARSCGVDEVSVAAFEQQWEANLAELSAALLERRYRPLPVRRVALSKPGGKERTIGVLAVRDRIAQRAAQQVLEPIFEAEFLDCSYGFRPGRGIDDAIHRVLCYRQAGCAWVFDADISGCFDALDHGLLLQFVGETIHDEAVIDLVHDWLETGLMQVDAAVEQAQNTPWERLTDRVTGLIQGQVEPDYGFEQDNEALYGGGRWQRQAIWQSMRADLAMLSLTAARPLARQGSTLVRRLARRRGATLLVAGLVGAAAVGSVWWALQRASPHGTGALQGGALSPLLANVYLHRFDRQMAARRRNLVRYADDMVICCRDQAEADDAAHDAAETLGDLRLRLHPDKTRVVSFERGFQFLGKHFQGEGLVSSPVQRVNNLVRNGKRRQ